MNHTDTACGTARNARFSPRLLCVTFLLLAAAGLTACGNKEKKAGQSLASVNGEEITVMQLNEEMQRANVPASKQEVASKQLLESLIDRQLLQNEALKEKTDRDPKVMQAVERAKALIIAQAYMQKRIGTIDRPTKQEVEDYFAKNPEFFSQRKQFDMKQLVIASTDMNDRTKAAMDSAKSLEEVAAWLDANNVKFVRTQLSRTSADLPPELSSKLLTMGKGQLFIIREGDRTLLISLADISPSPITLAQATPQIEQFLFNKKTKDAADAEIKRLRTTAKIEYLGTNADKAAPQAPAPASAASLPAASPAPAVLPVVAPPAGSAAEANDRGVAGLK